MKRSLEMYNDWLRFGVISFLIAVLMEIALVNGGARSNLSMIILLFLAISILSLTLCVGIRITFSKKVIAVDVAAILIMIVEFIFFLSYLIVIL